MSAVVCRVGLTMCVLRFIQKYARILIFATIGSMAVTLGGCVAMIDAELNNRGGFMDQKADAYWIAADTKPMRLLRAYLFIGSIARLSRESYYKSEREIISAHISTAVRVADDVMVCAYSRPGECVYFDERMAELEIAILRLAVSVFTKHENESLVGLLAKQLNANFPTTEALDGVSKLIDAMLAGGNAAVTAGKIVKSLLEFSEASYGTGRRMGALYRDSIELDMVAVLGSLRFQCALKNGTWRPDPGKLSQVEKLSEKDFERLKTISQFYEVIDLPTLKRLNPCEDYTAGFRVWSKGSGDLREWKLFLEKMAPYRPTIIPDTNAFVQVSDLIWRACEQITGEGNFSALSLCLGRGQLKNACGCKVDDDPKKPNCDLLDLNYKTKDEIDNLKSDGSKICPLIAFDETWERRKERSSTSLSRMSSLSVPRSDFPFYAVDGVRRPTRGHASH